METNLLNHDQQSAEQTQTNAKTRKSKQERTASGFDAAKLSRTSLEMVEKICVTATVAQKRTDQPSSHID